MFGGIAILVLTGFASFAIIENVKRRYSFVDAVFLKQLFFYHLLLFFAYYGYVLTSPSDSQYYYQKILMDFRGPSWWDFYGTSTTFIEFIGYPFIRFFGFSYEAIMALFSFFGFVGFIYFYIFFKERIRFTHKVLGVDLLTLIFLLPNLHFWSASFGKGAMIFLGIGLYFYGLGKLRSRVLALIIGGIIIYHVRPHVMLVVLVSSSLAFLFSAKGIKTSWRVVFIAGSLVAFFFIYKDVLMMVGIDEDAPVQQGLDLTHRATELTKATSGIDITSYSLPVQLLTFLYRPLFFDAPGVLGLIVSFENVFYVIVTLLMFSKRSGFKFLLTSDFLVKGAFLSFFTVSLALAQISGNLGLAIRQKSQVMILFMFVIISFLDEQKFTIWRKKYAERRRKERIHELQQRVGSGRISPQQPS